MGRWPGLRYFAPLGLTCPHLETQPCRLLECGREAAALPFASLLARLTHAMGRGTGYGKQATGHGARALDSSLATRHLSLSSRPAAGSRERAGKRGIRRPLGPATDGSGDPSSDGRIDTRADPKRWDLSRLAESPAADEAVLAEQGLEGWAANLDAEDR